MLDALRRGVRVPRWIRPAIGRGRGHHRIEVSEAELQPVIDLLTRSTRLAMSTQAQAVTANPPGSAWRWGFNWLPGEPRRARVDSEEGVDLDATLAEARQRASS